MTSKAIIAVESLGAAMLTLLESKLEASEIHGIGVRCGKLWPGKKGSAENV